MPSWARGQQVGGADGPPAVLFCVVCFLILGRKKEILPGPGAYVRGTGHYCSYVHNHLSSVLRYANNSYLSRREMGNPWRTWNTKISRYKYWYTTLL
jgi:hypothetical protein